MNLLPHATEKLNALILKQAETLGWRLALSPLVHETFSDWDDQPDGPELFEQYGRAVARSVRRAQKLELPPIDDPDVYVLKQETVSELRKLPGKLRKSVSGRREPTLDQLVACFQQIVSDEDDAYIYLKANLVSWMQFFREDSTSIDRFVFGKRPSPAALFDSWFAWSKGYDQETARQKISELGRFFRNAKL